MNDVEMRIFGLKKGWSGKRNKNRRRRTDRLKSMAERELFDAAGKSQKVMASVLGKYCDHWVHDGMKVIRQKIGDTVYREVEKEVLRNRRREIDNRIADIIDRVIADGNERSGQSGDEEFNRGIKADGKYSTPDITRQHPTSKRQLEDYSSLLTFSKGLEGIALLASLARNQVNRESVDGRKRIYVVRLGERMVEMTENDYRNYINRQKGMKQASPHNPGRLSSVRPDEKDDGLPEV